MSEDAIWLIVIGGVVLLYSVYVMRNALREQKIFSKQTERLQPLLDNRVALGGPDDIAEKISKILIADGQDYSPETIDKLMFDDEDVWVMYAYESVKKLDSVEGVLIARQIDDKVSIEAFVIRQAFISYESSSQGVTKRLLTGIEWATRQAGFTGRIEINRSLDRYEKLLIPLLQKI